jgi:hypothetical protein
MKTHFFVVPNAQHSSTLQYVIENTTSTIFIRPDPDSKEPGLAKLFSIKKDETTMELLRFSLFILLLPFANADSHFSIAPNGVSCDGDFEVTSFTVECDDYCTWGSDALISAVGE